MELDITCTSTNEEDVQALLMYLKSFNYVEGTDWTKNPESDIITFCTLANTCNAYKQFS